MVRSFLSEIAGGVLVSFRTRLKVFGGETYRHC